MNLSIRDLWLRRIAFTALFVAVGVVLSFGVLAIWLGAYPDNADPKNIYYVLWKRGSRAQLNRRIERWVYDPLARENRPCEVVSRVEVRFDSEFAPSGIAH